MASHAPPPPPPPPPPLFMETSVSFFDALPALPLGNDSDTKFHLTACASATAARIIGVGGGGGSGSGGGGTVLEDVEEVEEVAVDAADQEIATMMASLGLPATFGASSEVKSARKGRKIKARASSRVAGAGVAYLEHASSAAAVTDPTSQIPNVGLPAQDITDGGVSNFSGTEGSALVDEVLVWEPVWDENYRRYYYCNIHTSETTWEVPEGYESSLFTLGAHTGCEEVGSVGSGTYDAAVVPLGESSEENMETTEKMLDPRVDETCNGVPMESTRVHVSAHVKTTTKICLSRGTHIRFNDSDDDENSVQNNGSATLSSSETTLLKDSLSGSQDDSCLVDDLRLVCEVETKKNSAEVVESETTVITMLDERKKKRKFKRNSVRSVEKMPAEAWSGLAEHLDPHSVKEMSERNAKYWFQRYRLFARYDDGIKMDEEGWFSVTPQSIAEHQATRMCSGGLIIDAFTGVGGNAIQFALRGGLVIAIDIDPIKIDCARHNAAIYGVAHNIEFIVGDFFQLAPYLKASGGVFLSPPWGGPNYMGVDKFDLHTMIQPVDGYKLFQTALTISPNVVLFLPRNVDLDQLRELSWLANPPLACEVEKNLVNMKLKTITAYYGEFAGTKMDE